jgi:CheY-like chemotaxis protein
VNGGEIKGGEKFNVMGDELLCYSMLSNLLKNAVEASPDGGEININLDEDKNGKISISNDGAVPEEIRDNFFDKYTTSGKQDGTGLGTYSASLIARTQGGDISMRTSDEQGTTITITMPTAVKRPTPTTKPTIALNKMKFLVADDMQNIRMIVKSALTSIGCKSIVTVADGKKAIEALQSQKFDFVVSDWNMPVVTGIELLQWVRENDQTANIPFLMVTAERTTEQVMQAAEYGVSNYIVKPFTPNELIEKIKEIVGQ